MGIHKSGVTMKHCRLLLLSLYLSLPSVLLRCPPPCPPGTGFLRTNNPCTICKIVVSADCTSKETVRGYCGCPVCAKAEGETCGGMGGGWGFMGKCASFLTCERKYRQQTINFSIPFWQRFPFGVCVKKDVKKEEDTSLNSFDYLVRLVGPRDQTML